MNIPAENEHIEYKQAQDGLPNDMWETYGAFANSRGGHIVLGIKENKDGTFEVEGVTEAQAIMDQIWNMVNDVNKISRNVLRHHDVYMMMTTTNKPLVIVHVSEADRTQKPITVVHKKKKVVYVRRGSSDQEAQTEDLKYIDMNSFSSVDERPVEHFTLDDLNLDDLKDYQKKVAQKEQDERILNLDSHTFAKRLNVLRLDRQTNEEYLTLGGLLFFGKSNSILEYIPNFKLEYFYRNSLSQADWIDRISFDDYGLLDDMNLYRFYHVIYEKLFNLIQEPLLLDENQVRLSYRKDLMTALRELLVNSLMHAYYESDQYVKIEEYPDYYEFSNPGEMLVSKESFMQGGNSKSRNSIISSLFRRIGYSEKAGSGGPRIVDIVEKYHLQEPEFNLKDNYTTVRFYKINDSAIENNVQVWDAEKNNNYLLQSNSLIENESVPTEHFEQQILEYLGSHSYITRKVAIEELGMTEYRYKKTRDNLLKAKLIAPSDKKGRSQTYILSANE